MFFFSIVSIFPTIKESSHSMEGETIKIMYQDLMRLNLLIISLGGKIR